MYLYSTANNKTLLAFLNEWKLEQMWVHTKLVWSDLGNEGEWKTERKAVALFPDKHLCPCGLKNWSYSRVWVSSSLPLNTRHRISIWKLKAITLNINVYVRPLHCIGWTILFFVFSPSPSFIPGTPQSVVPTLMGMFFLGLLCFPISSSSCVTLYRRQQPLFLPRLLACSAALVAISNTSLTPSFVLAEHSR